MPRVADDVVSAGPSATICSTPHTHTPVGAWSCKGTLVSLPATLNDHRLCILIKSSSSEIIKLLLCKINAQFNVGSAGNLLCTHTPFSSLVFVTGNKLLRKTKERKNTTNSFLPNIDCSCCASTLTQLCTLKHEKCKK